MKKLALVVAMGLASMGAQAAAISGLYNTGAGLAANAQDMNYALSSTTTIVGTNGYVTANGSFPLAGNWLANDATSSWLTPTDNQARTFDASSNGIYTWSTTFNLTGFDATTASLTGRFAADNSAIAYLNGVQIGTSGGFSSWSSFSAASNFNAGLNTLSFVVTNLRQAGSNPTGLRVEFLSSDVTAVTPVPEADTYAMMFAGLGLMGLIARRKKTV